jgi:hypothetical protein
VADAGLGVPGGPPAEPAARSLMASSLRLEARLLLDAPVGMPDQMPQALDVRPLANVSARISSTSEQPAGWPSRSAWHPQPNGPLSKKYLRYPSTECDGRLIVAARAVANGQPAIPVRRITDTVFTPLGQAPIGRCGKLSGIEWPGGLSSGGRAPPLSTLAIVPSVRRERVPRAEGLPCYRVELPARQSAHRATEYASG